MKHKILVVWIAALLLLVTAVPPRMKASEELHTVTTVSELAGLLGASADAQTVTLQNDVELGQPLNLDLETLTLDFNGHTITSPASAPAFVVSGGFVSFRGNDPYTDSILSSSENCPAVQVNGGVLTLSTLCVYNSSGAAVKVTGGSFLTSSTNQTSKNVILMGGTCAFLASGGSTKLSSATIRGISGPAIKQSAGELTGTGCIVFCGGGACALLIEKGAAMTRWNISPGLNLSGDGTANALAFPSEYMLVSSEDFTPLVNQPALHQDLLVLPGSVQMMVEISGLSSYASIEGNTISLQTDAVLSQPFYSGIDFQLDLNGHTLYLEGKSVLNLQGGRVVFSNTGSGSSEIFGKTQTGGLVCVYAHASLIVQDSVRIMAKENQFAVLNSGSFELNDGILAGNPPLAVMLPNHTAVNSGQLISVTGDRLLEDLYGMGTTLGDCLPGDVQILHNGTPPFLDGASLSGQQINGSVTLLPLVKGGTVGSLDDLKAAFTDSTHSATCYAQESPGESSVKVLHSVRFATPLVIANGDLKLDLNGRNLYAPESFCVMMLDNGSLSLFSDTPASVYGNYLSQPACRISGGSFSIGESCSVLGGAETSVQVASGGLLRLNGGSLSAISGCALHIEVNGNAVLFSGALSSDSGNAFQCEPARKFVDFFPANTNIHMGGIETAPSSLQNNSYPGVITFSPKIIEEGGKPGENQNQPAPARPDANKLPCYNKDGNIIPLGFSDYINGSWKFRAPDGIELSYLERPAKFTDCDGLWAEGSIRFVSKRALFQGTAPEFFSPKQAVTRGMFTTVLGRLWDSASGETETQVTSQFHDVPPDAYYAPYVCWAVRNRISYGVSEIAFAPNKELTREEAASLLVRFLRAEGISLPAAAGEGFPDQDSIAFWAKNDIAALHEIGIVMGDDTGLFAPKRTVSRAEAAAMLHRVICYVLQD